MLHTRGERNAQGRETGMGTGKPSKGTRECRWAEILLNFNRIQRVCPDCPGLPWSALVCTSILCSTQTCPGLLGLPWSAWSPLQCSGPNQVDSLSMRIPAPVAATNTCVVYRRNVSSGSFMDKKQSGTRHTYMHIHSHIHVHTHTWKIYTKICDIFLARKTFDLQFLIYLAAPPAMPPLTLSLSSTAATAPHIPPASTCFCFYFCSPSPQLLLLPLFANRLHNFSHCRVLWPSNRRQLGRASCVSELRPQLACQMMWHVKDSGIYHGVCPSTLPPPPCSLGLIKILFTHMDLEA